MIQASKKYSLRSLLYTLCVLCVLVSIELVVICGLKPANAQDRKDSSGLDALVELLAQVDDPDFHLDLLKGIRDALKGQRSVPMPKGWTKVSVKLTQSTNPEVRQIAQRLALTFGDPAALKILRNILADPTQTVTQRQNALDALLEKKDPDLPPLLVKLLTEPALRPQAIRSLAAYDHPETPAALLTIYTQLSPAEKKDTVNTLASRPAYTLDLLDALENKILPASDISAFTVRQIRNFNDSQINERLNELWGASRAATQDVADQIKKYKAFLTPKALKSADLSNGRRIFRDTCSVCHTLFGAGGHAGPDLTGSNRANLDYILENILDPSAIIGSDYFLTLYETHDGRFISATPGAETEKTIIVFTLTETIHLPKNEIRKKTSFPVSMMPLGLLTRFDNKQITNLIAYLASPTQVLLPGQPSPIDPATGRVPACLEGESLKILKKSAGTVKSQPMQSFKKDKWSAAAQLWWTGAKPADTLVLELPIDKPGLYDVLAVLTKAHDYAVVQLTLDNQKLDGPLDLYHPTDVLTTKLIHLGQAQLEKGPHTLTIKIVAAHPNATKAYMFGLDYILLKPVK